jgi:hypothetical protein
MRIRTYAGRPARRVAAGLAGGQGQQTQEVTYTVAKGESLILEYAPVTFDGGRLSGISAALR